MASLFTINGVEFFVDQDVAARFALSKFELCAGYVCFCGGGEVWRNSLHRLLCAGNYVDHVDGNRLNCTRLNLRACTQRENLQNSKKKKGSSKYKGVSWKKDKQRWCVHCRDASGVRHFLGYYLDEDEAGRVYEQAAALYHGEFYRPWRP